MRREWVPAPIIHPVIGKNLGIYSQQDLIEKHKIVPTLKK